MESQDFAMRTARHGPRMVQRKMSDRWGRGAGDCVGGNSSPEKDSNGRKPRERRTKGEVLRRSEVGREKRMITETHELLAATC